MLPSFEQKDGLLYVKVARFIYLYDEVNTNGAKDARCLKLFFKAEFFNKSVVALFVASLPILHVSAAVGNHLEEAAARVLVFEMFLQMYSELVYLFRQERNLHLRRAGIACLGRIRLDDFSLAACCYRHRVSCSC